MRFLPGIIKDLYFSQFPPYVVFFVTAQCNARCKMCFYWQEIEKADQKKELSLEEIEKISQRMSSFYSLAISGGEPFLRQDLAQICRLFSQNNQVRHISIPTNGLLTKAIIEQTEAICRTCAQTRIEVEFSLDGLAQIHDQIRGVRNNFEIAIRSIRQMMKLENIYPNLKIKVNTTFSRDNQNHLRELIDFLKDELKLNRTNISLLHGQARIKESEDYDIESYKRIVDYLIKKQITSKPISWFDLLIIGIKHRARDLLVKSVKQKKYPCRCLALKKFIVIRETGLVYPCEPIHQPLGDLRQNDYSMQTLFNSDQAKTYLKNFAPNDCFCTWGCSVLNNILYSPYQLFRIFLITLRYLNHK